MRTTLFICALIASLMTLNARAQEAPTAGELLNKLDKAPPLGPTLVVPSPKAAPPATGGVESGSGSTDRAVENRDRQELLRALRDRDGQQR